MKNEINRALAAKKKIFLFMAALWMAAAGTVKAANEIYAVKTASGDNVVMTLYYDDQRINRGGENDWSVWKNVITKVTFDALDQTNEEIEKCENAKILRDGQLIILRGDKMYNIIGAELK
jgi:hypothetical protein